jgi:nicotinamide riboside kinase
MRQRIAISGSAGIGKSTLARALASELGVPYVPEGMREYLEGGGPGLHQLGHSGIRSLVYQLWQERKEAEARATHGFVADRSSYDFAAFWLFYWCAEPGESEPFLAETMSPDRYDLVALLPWGRLPLRADGVRNPNRWVQLHTHLLIEGMVRRCAPVVYTVEAIPVAERVVELVRRVQR